MTPPGGPEMLIILVIVLLLFGAKKLPELGSSVGKTIKNFKKGVTEAEAEDDQDAERAKGASQKEESSTTTPPDQA